MNKLKDESGDKKYFTQIPQLVWAKCRDTYDLSLWHTIKMVAGEKGECYLSTEDLSLLSMMSTGKISQCRKYLLEQGLIEGQIEKDPDYPQPVWHLIIPDMWKENIQWREGHDSLKARVALKKHQKSLHQMKPSPDEEPPSPDEEPPSPDETKKNQSKNQKEEPQNGSQKNSDYLDHVVQTQNTISPKLSVPDNEEFIFSKARDAIIEAYRQTFSRYPNQGHKSDLILMTEQDWYNLDEQGVCSFFRMYNRRGGYPYDTDRIGMALKAFCLSGGRTIEAKQGHISSGQTVNEDGSWNV